jgi:hypothetical protein
MEHSTKRRLQEIFYFQRLTIFQILGHPKLIEKIDPADRERRHVTGLFHNTRADGAVKLFALEGVTKDCIKEAIDSGNARTHSIHQVRMKSHSTVRRSLSVDHVDLVLLAAPHLLTDVHTLPPAFFELWEVSFHHFIAHSFRDFLCCKLRAQQRALASAMFLKSNSKASLPILRYFPVRAFLRLVFYRPSCFDT